MQLKKALVNKDYLLEKYPGKGGWTYAAIPEILQDKKKPFGWVQVKGSIDGIEIKHYKLMPMGNGKLFLPVKAEIRKKIKKKEGDWVHIILFADSDPLDVPAELMLCLKDEPLALKTFLSFPEGEQKAYINWIYGAKKEETKIDRLAKTVERLVKNLKLSDE